MITKHGASTKVMIVLKKENIVSTGQCQHLHFFFFLSSSYEATWGSGFPFLSSSIKVRDYSYGSTASC